ncbi:MAG: hypothetical protein U0S50_04215 [Sphingopyxis sp.]|uniref:hypothetical protein n=1 Tax=Sphingopyxis sp. TaxID=1908224 RepID=UPI002ABCF003|nr:hypothetical protein [Sphingopyxis sp.]MDZ3831005.1 hypothetical protein [Sphingopyxis sp.]
MAFHPCKPAFGSPHAQHATHAPLVTPPPPPIPVMPMIWLWLSAAAMIASALVHGIAGARRILHPLLALDGGILANELARKVLCFAWYATAVLMLMSAATVAWPGTPRGLVLLIGTGWFATGMANAAYTRGRHIIWPLLAASGIFALIGAIL